MAEQLLRGDEVIAMLKASGAPNRVIEAFRKQAHFVFSKKPEDRVDNVAVASIYGATSRRGGVELTVDDRRTQMDTKKAREIGLMLITAAEAAESDEVFIRFLENRFKIPDDIELRGHILLDLREIRQGSRDIVPNKP